MLFTTPLFNLFSFIAREPGVAIRRYVDDGLLTCRAKKEEFLAIKIAAAFRDVEQWAFDNGMLFDPNKFEAIHFSRKRNFDNVNIQLPLSPDTPHNAEPRIVKLTPRYSAMRWLRVYFDSGLSFKYYAKKNGKQRAESYVRIKHAWKHSSRGRALFYALSSACLYFTNTYLYNPGLMAWKE